MLSKAVVVVVVVVVVLVVSVGQSLGPAAVARCSVVKWSMPPMFNRS